MASTDPLLDKLDQAIAHWRDRDPRLADLAEAHPPVELALGPKRAFAALVESIVHQQVSLAAGRAIWARLHDAVQGVIAPGPIVQVGKEGLTAAGVSNQKAGYILDLATKVDQGEVDLEALADLPDDEVVEVLTRVKGIGPWTAKMFLMFHLHRPDVNAPEDLGLRIAASRFYDVDEDDAWAFLEDRAPVWSPWNTLAARVLWNARRVEEVGEDAPVTSQG